MQGCEGLGQTTAPLITRVFIPRIAGTISTIPLSAGLDTNHDVGIFNQEIQNLSVDRFLFPNRVYPFVH